ncbi:hypothetical protein HDU96_006395, partial [Phlyctochytrium bullatum]
KTGAIDNRILRNVLQRIEERPHPFLESIPEEEETEKKRKKTQKSYLYENIQREYDKYLAEKGCNRKRPLIDPHRKWNDIKVVRSGREEIAGNKTISFDTGIKTFLTGVQDNGDAFFLGERLSRFMKHQQNKVSKIQSRISTELNKHREVVRISKEITRRLLILETNQKSLEEEDYSKRYREINQLKRLLALKKEALIRKTPLLSKLELEADHLRQVVAKKRDAFHREVVEFCSQFKTIFFPKVITANATSTNQNWQQRSQKSIMITVNHEKLLKLVKEDAEANERSVIETSEAFSTQTCSRCLHYSHPGRSSIFRCSNKSCKAVLDRDANAAANIKRDSLARMFLYTQSRDPGTIKELLTPTV